MPSEKQKFASRLNEALDDIGMPKMGQGRQSALAKTLDVTPHQAGKWLRGEDFPKTSKLVKLAQYLGIRSNWLLTGNGDKFPNVAELAETDQIAVNEGPAGNTQPEALLSADAFEIAVLWMRIPEEMRPHLRKIMQSLAEQA